MRSAAKTASVPSWLSIERAAAMSATVEQVAEVVEGESEHAEHAVGAVDEGEPLLLFEHERRDAGGGEGVGGIPSRLRSRTSPSPSAASARCDSGARSPEHPSEPYSRTIGVMPASSIAA
jgi:hypothetical protein